MSSQTPEIISKYETLYAVRTGVTVLSPKVKAFDCGLEVPITFCISTDAARDVLITAAGTTAVLKDVKKEIIDAAVKHGFIMFYEMNGDDVVRCTPCSYRQGE